ncbi:oligosaccharide flippase family protein [Veronia pacifica]|uniref:Uncharacterized protein n=1 Tax=Veronia pacifica TaxID=1080227 RepID=A0A1C3ERD8_9GAMM|nr:hypothetical protein A8L45_01640 [Veronia pacifica]
MRKVKKLVTNSVLMFSRMAVMMLITLYTSRVAIDYLGEEVYGLFSLITGVIVLGAFLTTILESTAQRFISESIALQDDKQTTISTLFSVNLVMAITLSVIVYIIGQYYIEYKLVQNVVNRETIDKIFVVAIITFIVGVVSSPLLSIFVAFERMGLYAAITFCEVISKLLLLIFLMNGKYDSVLYYSLALLTSVLISRLLAIWLLRIYIKNLKIRFGFDRNKLKRIFYYVSWNAFGSLAAIANSHGVSLIVNAFFSLNVSAYRAIALQLNSAIIQIINSVQISFNPQVVKNYTKSDYSYLSSLITVNGRVVNYLCTLIIVSLVGNVEKILELWLGDSQQYLVKFIYLMLVDIYIICQTSALVSLVQSTGKIKIYQIVVGGTMLMNIPLCYFLLGIHKSPLVVYIIPIIISLICMLERFIFVKHLNIVCLSNYIINSLLRGLLIILSLIFLKYTFLDQSIPLYLNILISISMSTFFWVIFGLKYRELQWAWSVFTSQKNNVTK